MPGIKLSAQRARAVSKARVHLAMDMRNGQSVEMVCGGCSLCSVVRGGSYWCGRVLRDESGMVGSVRWAVCGGVVVVGCDMV